jgi:hypothetical protein
MKAKFRGKTYQRYRFIFAAAQKETRGVAGQAAVEPRGPQAATPTKVLICD